jgi:uncharacterized protein YuzE
VRVTHDPREDTAYIYLRDFEDGEDARQHWVSAPDINGIYVLDFDKQGRLVGIEVKGATGGLPEGFLDEANPV